ncbi:ribonuclease D [Thermithiobacillus plumbiphilus]|uniref:Ribonuclease D n=1 Tax=Thermithiobacillus plumbiphilus TaxID=1729899 RepID=A0ABU9DCG8_9PROT
MLVTTPEALQSLCDTLRQGDYIAVDTEFMREKTYYAKLCLIQVANDEVVAAVDPLSMDLRPLWEVLADPRIVKVFHAARQDLEIILDLTGKLPAPVFDTQIAATVAGHEESVSYARLVEAITGEQLDKTLTRTDWSRRPLDEAQLRYAEDDVRYLRVVYKKLRDELKDTGRLSWVQEDFERLADPTLYQADVREIFRRIKKGQMLRPKQLAILRELAAWREETAMARNKPRKWIVDDDVLFEIARQAPASAEALGRIRGLHESQVREWGKALLAAVARGLEIPETERPVWREKRKLKPADMVLVDLLQALVRQRGLEQGVAAQLLAGRAELEALVANDPDAEVFQGWRGRLVGRELKRVLDGELSLRVVGGQLVTLEGAG